MVFNYSKDSVILVICNELGKIFRVGRGIVIGERSFFFRYDE